MTTLRSAHLMQIAGSSGFAVLMLTLFVAWHGTPVPGEVHIIETFQRWDALRENEGLINPLGSLQLQLLIMLTAVGLAGFGQHAAIGLSSPVQRTEAVWILSISLALRFLTGPLKEIARAERPATDFGLRVAEEFRGYGFPSGHVYSDVLIFGSLAIVAPVVLGRTWGLVARIACLAVIALAGPARMVVGAHWPSDVVGGYLFGLAAICVAVALSKRLARTD